MPLRVFSNRQLRTANVVVLLFSAALFPMWYFASLYLQEVLHMPPLGAGLAFLPMALTIMACATHAGRLVARFGVRSGARHRADADGGSAWRSSPLIAVNGGYVADVLLPGLLVSTGIGLSIVPSTIAATAAAGPGEAGLASGLVNTSRQMGGALGLAILASLGAQYTSHLIERRLSGADPRADERLPPGLPARRRVRGGRRARRIPLHPAGCRRRSAGGSSGRAGARAGPHVMRPRRWLSQQTEPAGRGARNAALRRLQPRVGRSRPVERGHARTRARRSRDGGRVLAARRAPLAGRERLDDDPTGERRARAADTSADVRALRVLLAVSRAARHGRLGVRVWKARRRPRRRSSNRNRR